MNNEQKPKYIAAKELGNLMKEDFCPRCFWYEKNFGPFPSIFPGVFNIIDKNLKSSTWSKWKKDKKLPLWLNIDNVEMILTVDQVGDIEERYRQKYLILKHDKTGFILRGAPDLILKLKDGTLHIIDFKTARFKEEDQFFPVYEVQLNGYALLATKAKVSKLSLVYFNPINNIDLTTLNDNSFKLTFEPKIVPVDLKPNLIDELLLKVKEILKLTTPPSTRENCRSTCYYIDKILKNNKFF